MTSATKLCLDCEPQSRGSAILRIAVAEDARYRQYDLESGDARMTCWLKHGPALHVGRRLTLVGDDRVWTIRNRYATLFTAPPQKDWKVGGLY